VCGVAVSVCGVDCCTSFFWRLESGLEAGTSAEYGNKEREGMGLFQNKRHLRRR